MLGFLFSPLGRAVVGIGLALAVLGGAYLKGRADCGAKAAAAALRAELAAVRADLTAAQNAALRARQDAAENEKAAEEAHTRELAYADELDKRPAGAGCRLSPADLERLRP